MRLRRNFNLVWLALLVVLFGGGVSQNVEGQSPSKQSKVIEKSSPSVKDGRSSKPNQSVAELIEQLNHKSYKQRRLAEKKLFQRGNESVSHLIAAVNSGTPEISVRALGILEQIYTNPKTEEKTVERVEDGLEAMRDSQNLSVSTRAALVLERNQDLAERRALAAIKQLGGIVRYYDPRDFQQQLGNGFPNPPQIRGGIIVQPSQKTISYVLLGDRWKGGDEGLKYLKRLPGLRNLYVAQNKKFQPASAKALNKLELSIPNLTIQYRGLACLGVRGAPMTVNGIGCQVTSVEKGSAADKGQIKPFDQIVRFANKPVDNFQTLVKLIAEHSPGETVPVEVIRRGQRKSLKVVLQGWRK
ncbi:MAG: hypothetical protein Tsb009_17400 [Planctomycetaceae bacterium]